MGRLAELAALDDVMDAPCSNRETEQKPCGVPSAEMEAGEEQVQTEHEQDHGTTAAASPRTVPY